MIKAEEYLKSIGLESVIGEEFFNDDDKSYYTLQELMESYHQALKDEMVEVNNAYIEDADNVGDYDATGRVSKLWISKEDFDNIKCINN